MTLESWVLSAIFMVSNLFCLSVGWSLGRFSRRRKKWAESYHDGQDIPF